MIVVSTHCSLPITIDNTVEVLSWTTKRHAFVSTSPIEKRWFPSGLKLSYTHYLVAYYTQVEYNK